MRAALLCLLLAACDYPHVATDPGALPVEWSGGVYGVALADSGIGPALLNDGGLATDGLIPVPCYQGTTQHGTFTGPIQLHSQGYWPDVGRVVVGQYEFCAGYYSNDDLRGYYGYGASDDGFDAFLSGGQAGGLGIYDGHESGRKIVGVVSGLGLDGYAWRIEAAP